jgi:hypothetical protein
MSSVLVRRGADWSVSCQWQDEAAAPINITGFTVSARIFWSGGQQAVTAAITNAALGQFSFSLTEAQTANIPFGRISELEITLVSAGGQTTIERTPCEGT